MGIAIYDGDKGLLLLLVVRRRLFANSLNDPAGAFCEGTALGFEGSKGERRVGTRVADDADFTVRELPKSLVLCGLPVGKGHWGDTNVGFILFWHGDMDYRIYRCYRRYRYYRGV